MEKIAVDVDEVLYRNGELIEGSALCLAALKKHYELEIVTARNPRRVEETALWIASCLPDTFAQIHFNRNYRGEAVTKAQVCLDIGARYLIEDLDEHCVPATEVGIEVVQFGKSPYEKWENVHNFFSRNKVLTS